MAERKDGDQRSLVIIGASHAGLMLIEKVKVKLPPGWKVVVIEPNSHFHWQIGSVRAAVDSSFTDKIFIGPLQKKFDKLPGTFKLVQDRVDSVDTASKTLTTGKGETISYTQLVVASGSLANLPWKTDATAEDPVQAAKDEMKKFAEAIKANKHIVVGGGGAVGLELIGEIVDMYKDKEITLVDAREALLPEELGWNKSVGKRFEGLLKDAGVKVIHNARVTSPEASTFESTSITLSDGTALHGLYVAATGVKPRSGFLPKELLTEKGFVDTSPTFQCKADPSVWALGDAANHERKLALSVGLHVPVVASNLFKVMAKSDIPSSSLRQYKGDSRTIMGLISFGKGAGGGQAGPIRFPAFMVSMIKGKDLLASKGAALI